METTPAQTVKVEIYNQTYTLRSNDGDVEYIQRLAAFVDSRMREIAAGSLTVDSLKVAILAALNIADESRRGRGPDPAVMKGGPDRVARLIDMLERSFAEA